MYEVYISNGCLVTADDSLITFLSCRKPFILINKDIGQEPNSFHCYLKRNFRTILHLYVMSSVIRHRKDS